MTHQTSSIAQEMMDLEEFRRLTDISRPTVYKLARQNSLPIPVHRFGRSYRVYRRAVEDLLNQRKDDQHDGGEAA